MLRRAGVGFRCARLTSLPVHHACSCPICGRIRFEECDFSKDRHPHVIEARKALEYAEGIANRVLWATSGTAHGDPLGLAEALLKADKLTPEEGQ